MARRDLAPSEKRSLAKSEFVAEACQILDDIQANLFAKASSFRAENSRDINSIEELDAFFTQSDEHSIHGGFAYVHCADQSEIEEHLKSRKLTHRCLPIDAPKDPGNCLFTGAPCETRSIIAKAY